MPYRRPFEGCPGRHREAKPTSSGGGQGARAHSLPRRPATQPCSGALTARRRRHGGLVPWVALHGTHDQRRSRGRAPDPTKGGVLAGRLSIPLGRHLLGPKPPSAGLFLRRSLPMPPSPPCDPPSATTEDQHHDDRDDQHHEPDAHLTSPLPDFIGDTGPRAGPGSPTWLRSGRPATQPLDD